MQGALTYQRPRTIRSRLELAVLELESRERCFEGRYRNPRRRALPRFVGL